MKKNLFMVAAVALMAMVSCNKEEINVGNDVVDTVKPSVTVEFVASVEAETKTTLVGEAGKKRTEWVAGDAISINGVKFVTEEAGAKVVFTNAEELPSDFAAPFTAVYPYGADGVPAAQTAVAGNFDPKAVIETATSDNYSLSFKNSTSLLKFQVSAACKTVSVSSDTELAGKEGAYAKEVTLSGDFVTGKDYYIAVLPGTKANFVVRIDGYLSKNVASVTIDKSTIANMKTLPEPVVRFYVSSEYTHFTMNIYTWNDKDEKLSGTWPGESMKWDDNVEKYYYDFPFAQRGKGISYIINNGTYQTGDLTTTLGASNEYELNWHWLYFKPSENWKQNNAWFAACFDPGSGEQWMKSIGPDANGVYGFVQPSGKTKVEFARMNKDNKNDLNWSNKWNSSATQTIPTNGNNYFECTEGWWDAHNGAWAKYEIPD